MKYVAFEWDHEVGKPLIRWLVIECAAIGEQFGGIQAMPPREDLAYFLDEETAEEDAKMFAILKNQQADGKGDGDHNS